MVSAGLFRGVSTHVYCFAHNCAKILLRRSIEPHLDFSYVYDPSKLVARGLNPAEYFCGENDSSSNLTTEPVGDYAASSKKFTNADDAWRSLVERSAVEGPWKNAGFHQVCYSRDKKQWCLSNWIWASAPLARYFACVGDEARLRRIADAFVKAQHESGGWVVRNDYANNKPAPMLAANDTCYIGANAMLAAYEVFGDEKYLQSAQRCAEWVMETALPSGLVSTGLNLATGEWVNKAIIVDTGYSAAVFAGLYRLTHDERYRVFLERFVHAYIDAFFTEDGGFSTQIDLGGKRNPGRFSRGQAWALEGLIPAYEVLGDARIKQVIDRSVTYLVERQDSNGAWAYNFTQPLLGQDCKGAPVIAKAVARWGKAHKREDALICAEKALDWCETHTELQGDCPGGIFSFCMEGAVTHYLYSEAAFVYSSAYALETKMLLGEVAK